MYTLDTFFFLSFSLSLSLLYLFCPVFLVNAFIQCQRCCMLCQADPGNRLSFGSFSPVRFVVHSFSILHPPIVRPVLMNPLCMSTGQARKVCTL